MLTKNNFPLTHHFYILLNAEKYGKLSLHKVFIETMERMFVFKYNLYNFFFWQKNVIW